MALRFVDTNILIYSVSANPADQAKRLKATSLLDSTDLALSVQVLQEFYAQARRPTRLNPLDHQQAVHFINALKRYPILDNTVDVFDLALTIRGRWPISIWDSMIIASASRLGCGEVLTEDMQHGQVIDGVRIVNPFW
jgi:predicted nucleic acid-binding protein